MGDPLILRRSHGFQVDHVGLGVPNTEEGVRWFSQKSGVNIELGEPEPGQYYWSGGVRIGADSFLEIIGPNPAWKGFNPLHAVLRTLEEPQLLFWYAATSDFEAMRKKAEKIGQPIRRVEHINTDGAWAERPGYIRGFLGPGVLSQRPNLIQWVIESPKLKGMPIQCRLTDLRLRHPKAKALENHLRKLGFDISIEKGPRLIGISLETPNGTLHFEDRGLDLQDFRLAAKLMSLWWRTR